jgi:hypothetical protein
MSVADTAKALEAMLDDEIRSRLADGDFSDVSGFDLTPDERRMIQVGAEDSPEVQGYFNPQPDPPGMPIMDGAVSLSPFSQLVTYCRKAGGQQGFEYDG